MSEFPKVCIDRVAPRDLGRPMRTAMVTRGGNGARGPSRAVVPDTRVMWPNGSTLRIGFLEGRSEHQDLVREVAPLWTEHANLTFDFVGSGQSAQVRIAFDSRDGAWSYLGDRVLDIPAGQPTMNLGWVDEGVVLHEFGHTLGLGHEHQNPEGGLRWNEDRVIADLSGPPNNWSEAQIRHNVLDRYALDHLIGTEFDPDSIMLYFFPDEWVVDGEGTSQNEQLSTIDKSFIGSDEAYPRTDAGAATVPVSTITAVAGELSVGGEEDLFRFTVEEPGEHVVQTVGGTDLVMSLYGPDDDMTKVAEDDDSGAGRNPRITEHLGRGSYLVQLRHYRRRTGVGPYEVEVLRRTVG